MICALWSLSWKLFRDWWIPFSRSHLVLSKSHHMLRVHWRNGWIESRDPRWDRVVLIRWRQRNPKYPLLRSRRRRRRRRCCCFPPLIIFTAPPLPLPPLSLSTLFSSSGPSLFPSWSAARCCRRDRFWRRLGGFQVRNYGGVNAAVNVSGVN